jgi:transcriptional regulator with XRE-family HTH domain
VNRALQIRLDRGLTLSDVSTATGVSRRAIRALEDESSETQAPTLKSLADFYGVPASSLLRPAEFGQAAA